MNAYFLEIIKKATKATSLFEIKVIQNLWSGYGKIVRYGLKDSAYKSVVVKHVRLPIQGKHPRGWNTEISHQRKVRSYQVEGVWYKTHGTQCDNDCRIPRCLALETQNDEVLMVLEDLDAEGYSGRRTSVTLPEINACLHWLANFHATFMGEFPEGLWEAGTYWHLDTRPDELRALEDHDLRNAAGIIDKKLRQARFQTIVHGDAKLANFCFSLQGNKVAAVDFQYAGGGCGMKDVAYFVGSCLNEEECERRESDLLDYYFRALKQALKNKQKNIDTDTLEKEWRDLYPFAWTDFHRFLKGWSPGHWKINTYSERLSRKVLSQLSTNTRKAV